MSKRIAVVGAGVVGLCTAYYAVLQGHEVVVIEREGEHFEGCSYGNAGLIVPSHIVPLASPGMIGRALRWMWNPESPFYIKPRLDSDLFAWGARFWRAATAERARAAAPVIRDLNLASRALFEELAALSGDAFGLVKNGVTLLCNTQEGLDEEVAAASRARALGLEVAVLSAAETRRREPGLEMNIVGAVHYLQDGHMEPARFMSTLKRWVTEKGATIQWNTPVQAWRTDHNRILALVTAAGEIQADEYVLCGGSWSQATARGLRVNLPLQAGKGYNLTLSRPRLKPTTGAILVEGRVAVTPMGEALRFAGTMEIAGLNLNINPARLSGIKKSVMRFYPQFTDEDFKGIVPWCGLRPCSPDGLPYVGRLAHYQNLSAACGHAMMGLSLGPITGRIMAELLSNREPGLDIRLLNPDRYNS
jgi:D-amino-acid dehydrogenase